MCDGIETDRGILNTPDISQVVKYAPIGFNSPDAQ